jgi:hypothetical protein
MSCSLSLYHVDLDFAIFPDELSEVRCALVDTDYFHWIGLGKVDFVVVKVYASRNWLEFS